MSGVWNGIIVPDDDGRLYEMTITATGEVRDKDGNLISSEPVEAKAIVTHEQMLKIRGEQK